MKKLFVTLAISGILAVGTMAVLNAQSDSASQDTTAKTESVTPAADAAAPEISSEEATFHQVVKEKFIAGGPLYMTPILLCMIIGLAICIERVVYLTMATTNTQKLLGNIEGALKSGGVEAAKEVCRNTKGPVASIFYQGLDRSSEGLDIVEKSVASYGSVEMGKLEKGLSWISLFIALAPMLGFFGTVVGMVFAFDAIAAANNISPAIVADGIGVALITTVAGLIVAMVLQVFYNVLVAKIDDIVGEMENATISLMDVLVKHHLKK